MCPEQPDLGSGNKARKRGYGLVPDNTSQSDYQVLPSLRWQLTHDELRCLSQVCNWLLHLPRLDYQANALLNLSHAKSHQWDVASRRKLDTYSEYDGFNDGVEWKPQRLLGRASIRWKFGPLCSSNPRVSRRAYRSRAMHLIRREDGQLGTGSSSKQQQHWSDLQADQ